MFFSISNNIDKRFPNNFCVDSLWFNCDNGWQQTDTTFYKGYPDNYCRVVFGQHGAVVEHSQPRSFPLWYCPGLITNLDCSLSPLWADDQARIDQTGNVTLTKMSLGLEIQPNTLTIDQAKYLIQQRLNHKLSTVPDNIKVYCSGGVDTMLIYSMVPNCELLIDEYFQQDLFTVTNQAALEKFWAYKQIHHWTQPTWLATGSHGDEYLLRGPVVISMLTAWHNINFSKLLSDRKDSYHYHHFTRYTELWQTAWNSRHQLQQEYPTVESLNQQVLNILANDHQHWHLGNTLTWTPLKDIEIAKILLQCSINDLLPQFIDAQLTKDLIVDYNPNIIDFVSKYKNFDSKIHLAKLLEYHNSIRAVDYLNTI